MFSFLTKHFDVVFPYFSCDIFSPTTHQKTLFSVGQTDQKEETVKSSETVRCSGQTLLKGHQRDLLWQHIRLKLTLLCNQKKSKLRENGGGWRWVGGRDWMKHLLSQTTSKSHWSKESHKERERGKIIRDRTKLTEMQTEKHRMREWNNTRERRRKTLRQKFGKSRCEGHRERQKRKDRWPAVCVVQLI